MRPSTTAVFLARPLSLALLVACTDSRAPTATGEGERPSAELTRAGPGAGGVSAQGVTAKGTIPLPINQSVSSTTPAFRIAQTGTGPNGVFFTSNGGNNEPALWAESSGLGQAGFFFLGNSNNASPVLWAQTNGTGSAGVFLNNSSSNPSVALEAVNNGTGAAGLFFNNSSINTSSALVGLTVGTGNALLMDQRGSCTSSTTACNLAVFRSGGANRVRFNKAGRGFFNGGTQTGGADVAEAFAVEGARSAYEPGDVLVISEAGNRRVEKSSEPYSTRVAGVYATKPGVLLTERDIDDSLDGMVPLGVVGVIPTKVSAEGGAIRRGDLLVTSGTPGHAMRADPERLRVGMSLGKALEEFAGPGTGVIQVLVTVR